MKNKTIDYTEKIAEFLNENGKSFLHDDMEASGRTLYVYEIPDCKKSEFMRLFNKAVLIWDDHVHYFDDNPKDNETFVVLKYAEEREGPFSFRMSGYDFDGFYEKGESGVHNCKSYFHVTPLYWYYDEFCRREALTKATRCALPKGEIVVAFME